MSVGNSPTDIDRASFARTIQLQALRIPKKGCQRFMKLFEGFTLDMPRTPNIRPDGQNTDTKLMLLGQNVSGSGLEGLREDLLAVIKEEQVEIVSYELSLGYAQLTAEQVLRRLLPAGTEVPSSFETVGHIAHLNLRDELLPFKHVIGQVLLDKNPHIKSVVNKVGTIENEYRISHLEVLAGTDDMETEVRQNKSRFRLNFSEVYWNSRLEAEHKLLVERLRGSCVLDVMAGIGPFAIPIARSPGNIVYANDLNPRSYHWLVKNIALNKLPGIVYPFCMDGRAFIRYMLGGPLDEWEGRPDGAEGDNMTDTRVPRGFTRPPGGVVFDHAIMNLPATAVQFLDAFHGAFQKEAWKTFALPMVHCYTFSHGDEDDAGVRQRVEAALGGPLDSDPSIRFVRDVAPNKRMLCVSFRIPASVAFAETSANGSKAELNNSCVEDESPDLKRPRVGE